MFLSKEFTFDAAHLLTKYHGKCERLHGHTYRLRVTVEGQVGRNGMLIDFAELKEIVKGKVIDIYDHQNLNDFFSNPSAENIVVQIWQDLVGSLPDASPARLYEITLWETQDSSVTYRGSGSEADARHFSAN